MILDVRSKEDFSAGHIPGAIFIGIDGSFAPWVGAMIADVQQTILLVTPEGREAETVTRLARVGFDNAIGYLKGGFDAWKNAGKEVDTVNNVTAEELATAYRNAEGNIKVFDVRKVGEFNADHVSNAEHTPLDYINNFMEQFPKEENFYLHCRSGYRSVIAASILKARGFHNCIDVKGGFVAMTETDLPIVAKECTASKV